MARLARDMLSDALEAFIRGDAAAGREVCRRDDKVDALHRSVFRILLTHMMEDPHMISAGMELFLVSRNLERVADLATNIARGRGLPGRGQVDQAPRRGPRRRRPA